MSLGDWLREHGLEQYEAVFAANDVDRDLLPELSDDDLKDLGLSLGHRRKLMRALRDAARAGGAAPAGRDGAAGTGAPPEPLPPPEAAAPAPSGAERRQLTVVFCDLVGSTALAGRLDPEDMSEVLRTYHAACRTAIERHVGTVAKFVGDGVIAYFGFPRAGEDDAARAITAGLELATIVPGLETCAGEPLRVRVGIATGTVVVGEQIGEGSAREQTVVGETPNLAARLQALAEEGGVVVSPATRRLAGSLFAFRSLGVQDLKGIAQPVEAWAATQAVEPSSRFEARNAGALGLLVGRREELDLLVHRRAAAWSGAGQVVVLSGDAGVGKSRLAAAALEGLDPATWIRAGYQCSERHADSAFYPFLRALRQSARLEADDPSETRLDKLEAFFASGGPAGVSAVPVFAELLAIPTHTRYPPLGFTTQQRRERVFESYFEQLRRRVRVAPVLLLFEDAHWADATSLDLLEQIVQRIERMPVLCIVTSRPGFAPPWLNRGSVTSVRLGRLDRRHVGDLIAQVTGGRALPAEIAAEIVARAEGIPLYIEEITKAVIASDLLAEADGGYRLQKPLLALAVPETLQDSLMARLDGLPAAAKDLAQVGAAIGREFSSALAGAVLKRDPDSLAPLLRCLEAAELVQRTGTAANDAYLFRHALIQDVAYSSQLRGRRQAVHAALADALLDRFPEVAATTPEVVAHHLTEAGRAQEGMTWWRRAGEQALQRGAYVEGLKHLERGRRLIPLCPDGPDRAREELSLEVARGTMLLILRGQGAREVRDAYDRAAVISRGMPVSHDVHAVLLGLWRTQIAQADLEGARETGQRLVETAEELGDPALLLGARTCLGLVHYHLADFARAWPLVEGGVDLYRDLGEAERRSPIFLVGQHPYVSCLLCAAFILLLRGDAAAAGERRRSAVAFLEAEGSPFHLVSALGWSATLHLLADEPDMALLDYERSLPLLAEHAFPLWRMNGDLVGGAALVKTGRPAEGMTRLRVAVEAVEDQAFRLALLRTLTCFAQACLETGLVDEGRAAVRRALTELDAAAERWWEPELHRIGAELDLLKGEPPRVAASRLRHALAVAQRLGLPLFETRIAASLDRVFAPDRRAGAGADPGRAPAEASRRGAGLHRLPADVPAPA